MSFLSARGWFESGCRRGVRLGGASLSVLVVALFSGCAGETEPPEAPSPGISFDRPIQANPWAPEDLMAPAELAEILRDSGRPNPLILDIGGAGPIMGGVIEGSQVIGPTTEPHYLEAMMDRVEDLPSDADMVIYCGCCPFVDCPNIRPAFQALRDLGFTHFKLLDIDPNLRVDWVNRGYPIDER